MAFGNRLGRKQEFALHYGSPLSRYQRDSLTKTAPALSLPVRLLFRLLARLPLAANHALGALAGRLVYMVSPRYRRRLRENLASSGVASSRQAVARLARLNAAEMGKGAAELAWALFRADEAAALVRTR